MAPHGDYPSVPVWELLARGARDHPGKTALIAQTERVAYAELWERVLGVAGWLARRGVARGDRVLLRYPNSVDFVTAYFGALRAGGIVVALDPHANPDTARFVERDAGPRVVLNGEPLDSAVPAPAPWHRADLAVLQYTSGTTGSPKGAMMSHRNLVANALQNARWFRWRHDEVNLAVLPLFHTWGLSTCLHSTIAVGGTIVLGEPKDAMELAARHHATVLYGSATFFERLLRQPARLVPSLRHVKVGAMLTQGDLKLRWDRRFAHAPMQQGYGLTEASPETHNNPPARFKPGTVGVPLPDTDCRIVDVDQPDRVLAPGEPGEVQIAGPQVARGYWNGVETGPWLQTGDIGAMDEDGYLTIVDRKKDMLKFRGYTVSPNTVEQCLLRYDAVREAVVVGLRDDEDGEIPVAYVVTRATASDESLLAHCTTHLARYEVPRQIRRVPSIPKNAVGKPLRRVLRDQLNAGASSASASGSGS